jgi:hypothetical protein
LRRTIRRTRNRHVADNSADNKRGWKALRRKGCGSMFGKRGGEVMGICPKCGGRNSAEGGIKVLKKLHEALGLTEVFYGYAKTGEEEAAWRINGIEALEMWLMVNLDAWEEVRVNGAFGKPVLLAKNGGVFFVTDERLRSMLVSSQ